MQRNGRVWLGKCSGKACAGCLGWLLIVGVIGLAAQGVGHLFASSKRVPNVVGMNRDDAENAMKRAGLKTEVPASLLGSLLGDNKVCSTEPAAGAKTKGKVKLITAGRCAGDPAPKLHLVTSQSFCEQPSFDPTWVKVVVYLRNTGKAAVRNGTILPARTYQTGHRVSPLGDTLTDVNVPADGRNHVFFHRYAVGPGNVVVSCTVSIQADGISSRDRTLRIVHD